LGRAEKWEACEGGGASLQESALIDALCDAGGRRGSLGQDTRLRWLAGSGKSPPVVPRSGRSALAGGHL
jgi:hypothetical protein